NPGISSSQRLHGSIHSYRGLDELIVDNAFGSSVDPSNANETTPVSPRVSDATRIGSGDNSGNESDRQMLDQSSPREMDLHSLAPSRCLSIIEQDTPVFHGFNSDTLQSDVLPVGQKQQSQEIEESDNRSGDLDSSISSVTGLPGGIGCVISKGRAQTLQTSRDPQNKQRLRLSSPRIEKSVQPRRPSQKPVQSIRRTMNRDNRRKVAPIESSSRRKAAEDDPSVEQYAADISAYILREKKKCGSLGLPCYVDFLISEEAKSLLASVNSDKQAIVLKTFLVMAGGCDSLVSLRHLLQSYRESHQFNPPSTADITSNAQRVEMIKRLGEKAAYCTFLRYCHIHKLFVDNSKILRNANDNFVVSDANSVRTQPSRGRGNPVTLMEAQITKSMMQELYPDIQPTDSRYKSRYREISDWRRAGRRLERLVSEFSYGILGLLPLARYNLYIADSMYVTLVWPRFACADPFRIFHFPDNMFHRLIEVLSKHVGGILQEIGKAATPVVVGIFENSIDASETFNIENAEDDDIMCCPKGSPQLLELTSPATTAPPKIT
ncbi:MAG: hypothetical protein Q9181_007948, partial [Wetmoreana brouardii]